MTHANTDTETLRNDYRGLIRSAATLGWDAAKLKAEAAPLAEWFQGRGESVAQAWVSAAIEAISVEIENRNA